MYSLDKEQNTIYWNDDTIADDLFIQELVIQDMSLKIINKMTINQNNNIKRLLL